MTDKQPQTRLDARYSDETATAVPWPEAERLLAEAELFWISTVRPDGRPHVTPLPAVWSQGALHFCTGPEERKARNLAANPHLVLTTGTNIWDKGYDLVVEGEAVRITDEARLRELAAAWEAKYGSFWHFDVADGCFRHGAGHAYVYSVAPSTVFGFGKGEPFSQTRWRFTQEEQQWTSRSK
ncbi:pyridoxamine 5'-phosphate oxidase family protein [Streptomyces sp. R11]|uniref:Pyridoxamine 5'-phosphate oxidase family protein n=1 Tax=Streptomyces sp. R11 TaxID=3238625 RepID=A0AB39MX77_9ACTN